MKRKVDRLLEYLEFKGITENRATTECQLAQGLIYQAKSGKADLGAKAIEKILSTYSDLNRIWLLTGEGPMLKTASEPKNPVEVKPRSESPLVDYLQRKIKELEGKIDQLNEEKMDLLQENAVLKYENRLLTPDKRESAGSAADSLSADAI